MIKKNSEPNRIYVLTEIEKFIEHKNRFGGTYKNVNELISLKNKGFGDNKDNKKDLPPQLIQDPASHSFSTFKVVNRFKVKEQEQLDSRKYRKYKNEQHGRPQKTYHIVIDAKYIKIIVKRSYRAENLYDFFGVRIDST